MQLKKIATVLFYTSVLATATACNSMNMDMSHSGGASAAIASAEAANSVAKKAHYEWRDTGKMIKKAKAAEKAGNTEEAIKLAKKAEAQAKIALSQSKSEAKRYASRY